MTYQEALNKKRKPESIEAPSPTMNYLKMREIQKLK